MAIDIWFYASGISFLLLNAYVQTNSKLWDYLTDFELLSLCCAFQVITRESLLAAQVKMSMHRYILPCQYTVPALSLI